MITPKILKKSKKKPRGIATKYNARTKRTNPGKGSGYVIQGVFYGMLNAAKRQKFMLEAKKYNRTILQLLVNILQKGYNWYAALTMAKYFAERERRKIVSGRFNSKNSEGTLTTPKALSPEKLRKYSNTVSKNCANCGRNRPHIMKK